LLDARDFLETIAKPTVKDFLDDTRSLRHGYLAVLILDAAISRAYYTCENAGHDAFDLLGWHPAGRPKRADDSAFRERLAEEHEIYRVHRDFAKALKHGELTRGQPLVSSAGETGLNSVGYGRGAWGSGPYGGTPRAQVTLVSGEKIDISWLVREMLERMEDLVGLVEVYLQKKEIDGDF